MFKSRVFPIKNGQTHFFFKFLKNLKAIFSKILGIQRSKVFKNQKILFSLRLNETGMTVISDESRTVVAATKRGFFIDF